jgi:hypothetical protein
LICQYVENRTVSHIPTSATGTVSADGSPLNTDTTQQNPARTRGIHTLESNGSSDINVSDLELLHHFVTVTYLTMSNVPEEQLYWQNEMIKIGLQNTFLLRGILAFSALHLCYLNPTQSIKYLVTASTHQDTSLAQFREALSTISLSKFDPILAYSCILPLSSLASTASSRLRNQVQEQDTLSAFLDSIQLLRGVNLILLPWSDMFSTSRLMPLLTVAVQHLPQASTYPGMESLDRLQTACSTFCTSTSTSAHLGMTMTFTKAISQLRTTFARFFKAASREQFIIGIILLWILDVSDDFIQLLSKRHPSSLAILAHFAALLHQENHVWWLESLGSSLITDISMGLDNEWDEVLKWPKSVIQLNKY